MLMRMRESLGLPLTIVIIVTAALVIGNLAARHWDHILAAGPILLLAGCALMHLFMHRHGGHGGGGR